MKSKYIKIGLIFSFLAVQIFGFAFIAQAAVTFTVNVDNQSVKDGNTIRVTPIVSGLLSSSTYPKVTMQTFVNGQKVGNNAGLDMHYMQSGGEYQDVTVSAQNGFVAGANNWINVTLIGSDGTNYGNANAPVVTYTPASTSQPNSGAGSGAVTEYGCQAPNGVWTCNTDPAAAQNACGANVSSGPVVPATKCGCTDATFSAGTCGQTSSGSGQPAAGATPTNQQYQYCIANGGSVPQCTQSYPDTPAQPAAATTGNSPTTLYNPLPEQDLTHAFLVVAQGFLGIIGIWAVMFIIVGGFQMVTAAGNEEMYLKAKKTIVWAILGLLIALMSFSIIAIVEDILKTNIAPVTTGTSNNIPAGTPNNIPGGTSN